MANPGKRKGDKAAAQRARRARARLQPFDPLAPWHGTTSGYSNHCCRCDACRTAAREYGNEWRFRPGVPERRRAQARELARRPEQVLRKKARQYNIDEATLGSYLADGVCFACGRESESTLHVDHDHSCCPSFRKVCGDCLRGLLCRDCNAVLGILKDDRQRLRDLIAYLDRWEVRCASQ